MTCKNTEKTIKKYFLKFTLQIFKNLFKIILTQNKLKIFQ